MFPKKYFIQIFSEYQFHNIYFQVHYLNIFILNLYQVQIQIIINNSNEHLEIMFYDLVIFYHTQLIPQFHIQNQIMLFNLNMIIVLVQEYLVYLDYLIFIQNISYDRYLFSMFILCYHFQSQMELSKNLLNYCAILLEY